MLGASSVSVHSSPLSFVMDKYVWIIVNNLKNTSSCRNCDFSTIVPVLLLFEFVLDDKGINPVLLPKKYPKCEASLVYPKTLALTHSFFLLSYSLNVSQKQMCQSKIRHIQIYIYRVGKETNLTVN